MEKNLTCSFTGHRDLDPLSRPRLQRLLKKTLQNLIKEGFQNFISGGALGFDLLAAETVLLLKKKHPAIKLIMALPCLEQEKYWSEKQKQQYYHVLSCADKIIYTSEHYFKGCMFKRNRFLVDSASCILTFLEKDSGGTKYTVNYAEKSGINILYLNAKPQQLSIFS